MPTSLLETFATLDLSLRNALADISSPLLLALAGLHLARTHAKVDGLTSEHVVACLEAAGVAVTKRSVERALARAGGRVARRRTAEGEPSYRLMLKGEREVSPLLALGPLQVIRFDGSKPRSARLEIGQLLGGLSGTIRICDPYYGLRTLDTLESIPTSATVRFLSSRTNEAGAKLSNAIRDFRRERPKVDLRAAAQPSALHDRYVLSSSSLLLVGHGLKDIGAKESFAVVLDRHLAPDLLDETQNAFDSKWAGATPI